MLLASLAVLPVLIWIYIATGRGWFWLVEKAMPAKQGVRQLPRRVVAVIPARNEAESIGAALTSLLVPEGNFPASIVLVDDGSTDGTAERARETAERLGQLPRLIVLTGAPLPGGWTGKLWALAQGVEHALLLNPDYFLFTDGDVEHDRESLGQLVALAEANDYDLASYMVKLKCKTVAERALIPAFVFFFLQLYPPAWIASASSRTAGAAGGCILIRPQTLARIGGLASIRREVIDDCALARAVKRSGGKIWLGLAARTRSLRSYESFSEIGGMISRTAFSQLGHSKIALLAPLLGLLAAYVLPVGLLLTGDGVPTLLSLAALFLMGACYLPAVLHYKISPLWALTLPAVAIFYGYATLQSAFCYWSGRGGEWKGRKQDHH